MRGKGQERENVCDRAPGRLASKLKGGWSREKVTRMEGREERSRRNVEEKRSRDLLAF